MPNTNCAYGLCHVGARQLSGLDDILTTTAGDGCPVGKVYLSLPPYTDPYWRCRSASDIAGWLCTRCYNSVVVDWLGCRTLVVQLPRSAYCPRAAAG